MSGSFHITGRVIERLVRLLDAYPSLGGVGVDAMMSLTQGADGSQVPAIHVVAVGEGKRLGEKVACSVTIRDLEPNDAHLAEVAAKVVEELLLAQAE